MVRVEPFAGLRPRPEDAASVAAPPYDVLSSEEARRLAADNPISFLHVGKPEIDLPAGIDLYSDAVYAKGRENFRRLVDSGVLRQDKQKCFYIYRQVWGSHEQIGIVAAASADDYLADRIKKHELTREEKELDRLRHIETLSAQTGPVFLTYKRDERINELCLQAMNATPEYDFVSDDGVRQVLYTVSEPTLVKALAEAFRQVPCLYVADGHHRSASAVRIKKTRAAADPGHSGDEDYNFFLAVIFPHDQLKILPYNRLVRDLRGMSGPEFLKSLENDFSWEKTQVRSPRKMHEFCLYLEGSWYLLTVKPGSFPENDPVAALDVSILQNKVLAPLLGIENPRTDQRIDFVGGIRGTEELQARVDSGDFRIAFSLYPTTIEQLFAVADSGAMMPPKSTWFEPKLKDGLVIHLI